MTTSQCSAAAEPRPESPKDAFTQMNALICKIHEIQALAKISGNYLSGLDYPEDAPNTPDLQIVSTVNGIIIDLVEQACTMVDGVFRALPKERS